ncbi:MAG TPA: Na/Pi symporter [Catalimonadaceae bacterium]|nr:Na/Pi symporter [Catalimonadaceae bacterium]
MEQTATLSATKPTPYLLWIRTGQAMLTLFLFILFLIALELITSACRELGADYTQGILLLTSNPLVLLFIGLLATAIIQSSSTITASLVAMVTANIISLEAAVPVVLGANIGTCITSMMVSFGHLGTPKAFRRGYMVASSHVIFNVATALLFFPLEEKWHVLSASSRYLATHLSNWGTIGEGWFVFNDVFVAPFAHFFTSVASGQPLGILVFSLILLFMCIFSLTALFRHLMLRGDRGNTISRAFSNPLVSLLTGTGVTAAIHSSTVISSLSVMLAATEKISPKKLFPFILGANVGTTVTALMAAIGRSEAGLAIALCHLLYNVLGVLIFYPFESVRDLTVNISRWSGIMAQKSMAFAFGSLLILFFALPFLVIFIFGKF